MSKDALDWEALGHNESPHVGDAPAGPRSRGDDRLLAALIQHHGDPRYDIPPELTRLRQRP